MAGVDIMASNVFTGMHIMCIIITHYYELN